MDAKNRVDKMLEDGVITHEQAQRLRSSVDIKAMNSSLHVSAAKWPWFVACLLILMMIFGGIVIVKVNAVIDAREVVKKQQSDLDSQHQRRHDLTPQLIDVVKRYLEHEKSTLESITSQRTALAPLQTALQNFENSTTPTDRLTQYPVMSLLAVTENYPTLRSADQFQTLQAQIEGTENRINIARLKLNQSVREFNALTQKIPGRWFAQWMGYPQLTYVQAAQNSEQPPKQAW